jgi:DUF1680 family protein
MGRPNSHFGDLKYEENHPNGVTVLEGKGRLVRTGGWSGLLCRPLRPSAAETVRLRLIPYHAWGDRCIPCMTVWMPLAR